MQDLDEDSSAEEIRENKQIYKEMSAGLPPDAICDFGEGPMIYVGEDIYLAKNGHWYSDEED
jgi:hypothetical protein